MEIIIELEEIVELLTVDRYTLLMQVLLQQVTLVIIDKRCRPAGDRAFNGLANETAVTHLRK